MTARRCAAFFLFGLASACSSGSDGDSGGGATPPPVVGCAEGTPGCLGWQTCPPEMTPDPDQGGCREILPAAACPPGTMAVLGNSACQPVGPRACASGFRPAASGWGCEAIAPAAACTGATREALGETACVPVGDCSAPFPPPGATHFVDAAFTDAQLDGAHFRKIQEAINAAPAGALVAVEGGTYPEGLVAPRAVSIVGRCAERVRLVGSGQDAWGIYATGAKSVSLQGVTLEDHYEGARVQGGAEVRLTDVVIEAPRSSGLIAWQNGSRITAERTVIRNVRPHPTRQTSVVISANADEGGAIELTSSSIVRSWDAGLVATNPTQPKRTSTIVLRRSIVRDTDAGEHSRAGAAVVVSGHSRGEIVESAILATRRIGVLTYDPGSSVEVRGSVVDTTLEDKTGEVSAGMLMMLGASGKVTDTTLREATQVGAYAADKGTSLSLSGVVFDKTRPGADGDFGIGAWAEGGAALDVERSAFVSGAYYGVAIVDADTKGTLTDVLIKDTRRNKGDELGRGINVEYGGTASLDRVTLVGNSAQSLFVRGQNSDGTRANASAKRLLVMDTVAQKDGSLGTGIAVETGALLDLDVAVVARARSGGISVNELPGNAGALSEATIHHTIVRDTLGGGDAVVDPRREVLSGAGILSGGKLTLRASAISGSVEFGLLVGNPTAAPVIENCVIGRTARGKATGNYGHGIVAIGVPSVIIRDTVVRSNTVGIAFDRSAAVVSGVLVQGNDIGINVQGEGFALTTAKQAPDAPVADTVVVTDDSRFVDNATRVGGGALPLPEDPLGTAKAAKGTKPKPGTF